MRRILLTVAILTVSTTETSAQLVPETSQAARVDMGYRRASSFRVDPFRHIMIPHWGFVFSVGGTGENSVLNFADAAALRFIDENDEFLPGDIIDLIGLIPAGRGVRAASQAEGGFYLGGPFGRHFQLGFSAQTRGYGSGLIPDALASLVRDGNMMQTQFDISGAGGIGLATAELGAHSVFRFGPLGTEDGVHLSLGLGGRLVRPGLYFQARPQAGSSTVIQVGSDSILADLAFEKFHTPLADLAEFLDRGLPGGVTSAPSSLVGDFLIRMDWPTSGFSFEAMFANLGSVTVPDVVRDTASLFVATADPLFSGALADSIDAMDFVFADSVDLKVKLPQIIRFSAGAWANAILQLDVAATMPVSGDFESPLIVDLGTTWRFVRSLPLRAGLILGGHQGLGYSAGIAVEGRNLFFQVAGQSLGGFFQKAKGAGARLDFGIFF